MEPLVIGPVTAARAPFLELSQAAWEAMIAGIRDGFFKTQSYARDAGEGGRLVFISSPAAARAIAGMTLEAVAGAFLTTVAQVAAVELAPRAVTSNVVIPALEPDSRTVEAVVRFLESPGAAGVTGAVIAADGGYSVTKGTG